MTGAAQPARPMRADAQRNRERLLAAARPALAEHGVEASLDDIARRAGVGPGTLYRHFPTREALIEAIYRDDIASLAALAKELAAARPSEQAIAEFMRAWVQSVVSKRGMKAALMAATDRESELFSWCRDTLFEAVETLVAKARADGVVRPDLEARDLLRLCHGIGGAIGDTAGIGDASEGADRLLSFALDGVRARPGEQPSGAAGSRPRR
jgi:AcrR family transcriptional regulator